MGWVPRITEEIVVPQREKQLYLSRDPSGAYHSFQWPKRSGIDHRGHFPVAVGRKLYTDRAYDVFISAQSKHGIPSYLLEALPGKRNEGDRGYRRLVQVFGEDLLDAFHSLAAEARHRKKLRAAGGDPDLFVQHRYDPNDRFFVEVKLEDSTGVRPYKDAINEQQEVLFPLIEHELCDVRLLTIRVRRAGADRPI
jgi:hypothetical protein